jgi:predicted RNase H-like nuclease (RuvC/YqgF family)
MDRTTTQEGSTATLTDEERLIEGAVEMLSIEELVSIRNQARPGGMTMRLLGHITAQGDALTEARDQTEGLKELNQRLTSDFDAQLTGAIDEAKGQSFAQVFNQLQASLNTIRELEGAMIESVGDIRAQGRAINKLRQSYSNEQRHVASLQHQLAEARRGPVRLETPFFGVVPNDVDEFADFVDAFADYVWQQSQQRRGRGYGFRSGR